MDEAARAEIAAMARADETLRARLVADGRLFDGYHPEMRALHEANATRLLALVDRHGWPDGAAGDAAWLVAQHAPSLPDVQRRLAAALAAAVAAGRAPGWQAAMLTDRIAVNEGRPQRYGTQFDWDDRGRLSPLPIADSDGVDARREAIGLVPIGERQAAIRAQAEAEGQHPPADPAAPRAAAARFAASVGWR